MAKLLGSIRKFFRRRDKWRKHPRLSNQLRRTLPDLGLGVIAFSVYLVGKQVYNKLLAPCSSSSSSHHSSHSSTSHWLTETTKTTTSSGDDDHSAP
ncbi:NADH dehydrogenase [ubiquinone] 1 beta subcomplex subunit 3-B-like [Ziziphus jujuba]|uniref:NADH dehydrogenase [ubiquinone] 1 beta subcomplex subunit 3-B-like n=1 Tax=Ziziphus jujuba TaxID=326968 RepID=A0A6P6G772_ZIZJJ|nr:NADH dehydrogenase [ubiquinone] 1 beta subcomplex subunit 3-B-like [Ziziphus jujuba]